MADYEQYRTAAAENAECLLAFKLAKRAPCIVTYERSFMGWDSQRFKVSTDLELCDDLQLECA